MVSSPSQPTSPALFLMDISNPLSPFPTKAFNWSLVSVVPSRCFDFDIASNGIGVMFRQDVAVNLVWIVNVSDVNNPFAVSVLNVSNYICKNN